MGNHSTLFSQGTSTTLSARWRDSGGLGGGPVGSHGLRHTKLGSWRTADYGLTHRAPRSGPKTRRGSAGRNCEGSIYSSLPSCAAALGSRWTLFSRTQRLRVGLRRPGGPPAYMGIGSKLLGNFSTVERRLRKELDQSPAGAYPLSR